MNDALIFDKIMTYTDDTSIGRALMREFRTGYNLQKATEEARLRNSASEVDKMKEANKNMTAFKAVSTMPGREWFQLRDKYGDEELNSRQFHKWMHKRIPQTKIANV